MIAFQKRPELSHVERIESYSVFVTMSGRVGIVFHMPAIDLESESGMTLGDVDSLIKECPEGTLIRFNLKESLSHEPFLDAGARGESLGQIGHVKRSLFISFENHASVSLLKFLSSKAWSIAARQLVNQVPITTLEALGCKAFTEQEIREAFDLGATQYERKLGVIDTGPSVLGSVRIFSPKIGARILSATRVSEILGGAQSEGGGQVGLPIEVSVTVKKLGKQRTELQLRSKLNQKTHSEDPLSAQQAEELHASLEKTEMEGDDQIEVEWIALVERESEEELRSSRSEIKKALSEIGSSCIETVGIEPSFIATRLGSEQHVTFKEFRSQLPAYLPIHFYGEAKALENIRKGALLLHRLDETACAFDLFDQRNHNSNAIVVGDSGSGKSVFIGQLSCALMDDPCCRIIKSDVGGSYERECARLGGTQISFDLSSPSGLDPLRTVIENPAIGENEAAQVLATLVAVLLKEQEEKRIPKVMLAEIEAIAKEYVQLARGREIKAGIDSYYEMTRNIERRLLLKRWISGGMYENVFKRDEKTERPKSRYIYYNFKDIFNAASPDYADGVMAAVMAEINLEILRAGKHTKERICLVCDEVKFFISRHYETFDLLAANFRKFGHSLIVVIQDPTHIEQANPKTKGGEDQEGGLWVNLQVKVFLKTNLSHETLRKKKLSDFEIRAIEEQANDKVNPRQAVIQDGAGSRVVKIIQSRDEYWRTTSDKEDNLRLQSLLQAVPGLTSDQAIECLASIGAGGGL